MQHAKILLAVLGAYAIMDTQEMELTALVCISHSHYLYIAYFYYVTGPTSRISMNVLAPHTTAIHKQDAKTQLEGLNATLQLCFRILHADDSCVWSEHIH